MTRIRDSRILYLPPSDCFAPAVTRKDLNKNRLAQTQTGTRVYSHQNRLSIAAAVLSFMAFACEACGSSFKYNSDRGLRQHQLNCEEFLQADNEASTVDDALEKYRRKLQRKKDKAALSEVSLTGSGVCYSSFFISILIIHCRMHPWL
jgi:hypothetical protein